jgi:uncharacterized membrane protein
MASATCAWLVAHGWSPHWRIAFRLICHGIESRCLLLFGVRMPICARCTAIYGGLILGSLLFRLSPAIQEKRARIVAAVGLLPMAIDGVTQLIRVRESTNLLRVETGLVAGMAIALWALSAARAPSAAGVHRSLHSS